MFSIFLKTEGVRDSILNTDSTRLVLRVYILEGVRLFSVLRVNRISSLSIKSVSLTNHPLSIRELIMEITNFFLFFL